MTTLPWRLKDYFFFHQEVRANPSYDRENPGTLSAPNVHLKVHPPQGDISSVSIELLVTMEEQEGVNNPYSFLIGAFAILEPECELNSDTLLLAQSIGYQVLYGAVRERVADMTARGPWGGIILQAIPLAVSPATLSSDP